MAGHINARFFKANGCKKLNLFGNSNFEFFQKFKYYYHLYQRLNVHRWLLNGFRYVPLCNCLILLLFSLDSVPLLSSAINGFQVFLQHQLLVGRYHPEQKLGLVGNVTKRCFRWARDPQPDLEIFKSIG